MYRNNESVTPNPRSPLEDYSLHIIDLHTGRLSDTRSFKCDKIILSHNQGLYLYRNILAVLSVQQQTIHVFQVGRVQFCITFILETYTIKCPWWNFEIDYKYINKQRAVYLLHFFKFRIYDWMQKVSYIDLKKIIQPCCYICCKSFSGVDF